MSGWKRMAVPVLGSLGAGAAVAALHERRRRRMDGAGAEPAPEGAQVSPPATSSPAPGAPAGGVDEDPAAAIDAARERLRRAAERSEDAGPPPD